MRRKPRKQEDFHEPVPSYPSTGNPLVDAEIIRAAVTMADAVAGLKIVREWAGAVFDSRFSHDIVAARIEVEDSEAKLAETASDWKQVRKKLTRTPRQIPGAHCTDKQDKKHIDEVPFRKWQRRHQGEALLSGTALGICLTASLLGSHAAIAASGIPVFIEEPELSYFLAALAPTASVAVKFIGSSLREDGARRRSRFAVHALASGSFLGWLGLFAAKFHGLGGAIDIFGNESLLLDQAYVAAQIGTEVLVGAALFLNLDRIAARYAPDFETPNLQFELLRHERDELNAEQRQLLRRLIPAKGRQEQLEAQRALFIKTVELAYLERRSRFDPDPSS